MWREWIRKKLKYKDVIERRGRKEERDGINSKLREDKRRKISKKGKKKMG